MMRPFSIQFVVFTLIWVAGCASAPQPSLAEDKYQISEITLERSGSWGIRSGYKIVLRKDGTAEYAGDIHAKRKGKYHGEISKEQFEQLTKVIIENDYFSLGDKYRAPVTDTDTVTTSIVYSEGRKRVEDFGRGGGERLTKIEQEIDQVAEQIAWAKNEGRAVGRDFITHSTRRFDSVSFMLVQCGDTCIL
ncbi:MAG: DUF6438 domain-containing protein [Pyrinomonadaceae bacterium]|nr:hypothetical protein [Pyrinomonadaceae bacterium]MDQ3585794.1 DUF6438 domain-containing protein [Acidobacteriota bacterium]